MRTSATGSWHPEVTRQRGFTLVEVMLALAIIGIVATAALLALPDRADEALEHTAAKLLGAIEDCRHHAVLSGTPSGLSVRADGAAAMRFRGRWVSPVQPGDFPFADGVTSDYVDGDDTPGVVCLPSGETRLPPLALLHAASGASLALVENANGDLVTIAGGSR